MAFRLPPQQQRRGDVVASGVGNIIHSSAEGGVISNIVNNAHQYPRAMSNTHDLTPELASLPLELDESYPLPFGWQKFLDLQTGEIYYKNDTQMEYYNALMNLSARSTKINLKLNLSLPTVESPKCSITTSPSLMTSELNHIGSTMSFSNGPRATSMVLVGCRRCFTYAMTSVGNPKCPNCEGTNFVDFLHENSAKKTRRN